MKKLSLLLILTISLMVGCAKGDKGDPGEKGESVLSSIEVYQSTCDSNPCSVALPNLAILQNNYNIECYVLIDSSPLRWEKLPRTFMYNQTNLYEDRYVISEGKVIFSTYVDGYLGSKTGFVTKALSGSTYKIVFTQFQSPIFKGLSEKIGL